ncbi:hypothetical protein HMPREF1246_1455 [Acidaminococcus sp. BV3L6]|nr:hypothetical protein HMPREF1246_1455 [Acidaminococcus sp. BV3L6]
MPPWRQPLSDIEGKNPTWGPEAPHSIGKGLNESCYLKN